MHKEVLGIKKKLRDARRNSKNKRIHEDRRNFQLGDFVLVATAHVSDKLEAKWKGPFKIIEEINDKVYKVEDMITGNTKEVHVVRLKFYDDNHLDVKIKEHLQYHNQAYEVSEILSERVNNGVKEVLVRWRGFEEAESTWEPLESILADVPDLYELFKGKDS
jgi:hypothetical protein